MMFVGPKRHGTQARGPITKRNKRKEFLVYFCNRCTRKWVSRISLFSAMNDQLRAMMRCYDCNSEVFPQTHGKNALANLKSERMAEYKSGNNNDNFSGFYINTCGSQNKSAIFAWESITKVPVLFDTGAEVSVISTKHCGVIRNFNPAGGLVSLRGVTGQIIKVLGKCVFPLDLGFSQVLNHDFAVVDLELPYIILGLDFMKNNGLILDPKSEAVSFASLKEEIQLSTFDNLSNPSFFMRNLCMKQI